MAGALAGIRIIDFGQYIAGPLAAVMLSDQGADVIHVDPPGGPRWKTPADAFLNRGKRRITLDVKRADDRTTAQRLVDSADVLIENYRPGVMDRLGLGAPAMTRRNPRLIYCTLPGFAANDARAGMPAWEGVLDAATDNCRARAGEAPVDWDDSQPTYSAIPVASNFAAYLAATGIVMALVARQRSGRGQCVDVPLFHAMFAAIGPAGAYVSAHGLHAPRPIDVNGSGTYRCGDGRYVQFDPSSPRFLTWFADAAGISSWGPEFLDLVQLRDPQANRRLHTRLQELFRTRSAAAWEELGQRAGVALAWVRTTAEWLRTAQARQSSAVLQLDDPELGPTWMPGLPVHLSASPGAAQGPRYLPDADHTQIVSQLDQLPARSCMPASEPELQAPLQGLQIVDLTQVLAGPTGGRLLAEFGADVIKINGPQRRISSHGYLNRGKRSLLLDVESIEGQQVFWKLIQQADIVLQNFPPGTAERYGIGYEQVRARKPDIIYTSVSCYGHGGPWTPGRGYERQAQAVTGIMDRVGTVPAILGPYNLVDLGTGVMAAFATALGVYYRYVTGQGQHVQASLAQTATYHQAPYMLDYQSKVWDEPRGWESLGASPLRRFYRAQDGWFFLGTQASDAERLWTIEGLQATAGLTGAALEQALAGHFATLPVAVWVDRLRQAGLGAHAWVHVAELMSNPWVRRQGLSITQVSEEVGEVTMPGVPVHLSATPVRIGAPARQPGADAAVVLQALGLGDALSPLQRSWVLQTENLPQGW